MSNEAFVSLTSVFQFAELVHAVSVVGWQDGVEPRLKRHRRDQALGQLDERLVEVARVRVQEARLADDRLGHARVAVPDNGDVVVSVEVAPAVRVEEPDALAADDVQRVPKREPRFPRRGRGRSSPVLWLDPKPVGKRDSS
jgi:hypothetical protein